MSRRAIRKRLQKLLNQNLREHPVYQTIFEAGRFAAQTADMINGPLRYGLLSQHQLLCEERFAAAWEIGQRAGLEERQIDQIYQWGINFYEGKKWDRKNKSKEM